MDVFEKADPREKRPLYRMVARELEARIRQGVWQVGTKLPPEKELSEVWQTSSVTIRRALSELADKGLIKKRQGAGSFVASKQPIRRIDSDKLLGFVIPNSTGYRNGQLVQTIETAARQSGYSLIIQHSHNKPEEETTCVKMLLSRGVAGILISPTTGRESETLNTCADLIMNNIPFVLVDRYLPVLNCNYVTTDNESGAYEATKHLIDLGRRRIAYIGDLPSSAAEARERGYRRALEEAGAGVDPKLIIALERDDDQGVILAMEKLLEQSGGNFTAVFTSNDGIAQIVYRIMGMRGIRIPDDVAVVGYDDAPFAAFMHPALTTVRQSAGEVALAAVKLLVESIQGSNSQFKQIILGQELIVRESTTGKDASVGSVQSDKPGLRRNSGSVPASPTRQSQVTA